MPVSNKKVRAVAKVLSIALVLLFALASCHNAEPQGDTLSTNDNASHTVVSASWANSYSNIGELSAQSDFVGIVEIAGVRRTDEIVPDGVDANSEDAYTIPYTVYSAKVVVGFLSSEDEIEIHMTGREGRLEIADDPLLKAGDIWFIFARKNDDGTHTILGGPQGRFAYNEKDNTISSLSYLNSPHTRTELEEELGIFMLDIDVNEVKSIIETQN